MILMEFLKYLMEMQRAICKYYFCLYPGTNHRCTVLEIRAGPSDPGVDLSIVAGRVILLIFNIFIFRTANKTVRIRNNNLLNEQTQILLVIFN